MRLCRWQNSVLMLKIVHRCEILFSSICVVIIYIVSRLLSINVFVLFCVLFLAISSAINVAILLSLNLFLATVEM